jgi:hypothetical protein
MPQLIVARQTSLDLWHSTLHLGPWSSVLGSPFHPTAVSDGDSSSADDGRPQYFIHNSDSSATSGDDSSDDSSSDSSAQERSRPGIM